MPPVIFHEVTLDIHPNQHFPNAFRENGVEPRAAEFPLSCDTKLG